MNIRPLLLLMLPIAFAATAEAKVIPEVQQLVSGQIARQAAVRTLSLQDGRNPDRAFAQPLEGTYSLAQFALRIRGEIGFDVASFATIKVVPTVELFWLP